MELEGDQWLAFWKNEEVGARRAWVLASFFVSVWP